MSIRCSKWSVSCLLLLFINSICILKLVIISFIKNQRLKKGKQKKYIYNYIYNVHSKNVYRGWNFNGSILNLLWRVFHSQIKTKTKILIGSQLRKNETLESQMTWAPRWWKSWPCLLGRYLYNPADTPVSIFLASLASNIPKALIHFTWVTCRYSALSYIYSRV